MNTCLRSTNPITNPHHNLLSVLLACLYATCIPLCSSSIPLRFCSSVLRPVFDQRASSTNPHHNFLSALLALQCHVCLPTFLLTHLPEHVHDTCLKHLHEHLPENLFNSVFNY